MGSRGFNKKRGVKSDSSRVKRTILGKKRNSNFNVKDARRKGLIEGLMKRENIAMRNVRTKLTIKSIDMAAAVKRVFLKEEFAERVVRARNNKRIISFVNVTALNRKKKRLTGKKKFEKLRLLASQGKLIPKNKLEGMITILFIPVVSRPAVRRGMSFKEVK